MTQTMDQILRQDQRTIHEIVQKLTEDWVGRDVYHLHGKFSGRRAQIRQVILINNHIQILAQPYRLRRNYDISGAEELIWDHPDARAFHPLHWFRLADD